MTNLSVPESTKLKLQCSRHDEFIPSNHVRLLARKYAERNHSINPRRLSYFF
jgi:hypothetical protein